MNVTINKNDIINVLSNIQGLTNRKSSLVITETVLIKTIDSGIELTATDLETGFLGIYPATVDKEGIIAINAKKLYEIVKEFPSNEININEIENHWLEITNNNVNYHIVGMNPDDFPKIPVIDDVSFIEVKSSVLKKMIDKTIFIGFITDDKRVHINGIYFESIKNEGQNTLRMVSTDGNRLSLADYNYNENFDIPKQGIILPKKSLIEVNKFLDKEEKIQTGTKDNHFIIKKNSETIIIRLFEGEFPKYGEIIVKDNANKIIINRKLFLNMLKRMSILYSDSYKAVMFDFDKDKLMITATNPDIGESKEDIDINYKGDKIEAAFNPKFFIDTLNIINDDDIVLYITDEQKPCFIEGNKDKQFLSVIMPMRI